MLVIASGLLSTARRNGSSALCSLLDRLSQHFPLLSVRQMGTHYHIWLFEMEYFDGLGAFAPGPFLLLAEHVVLKGHALWIGFLELGFGSIGVGGSCARSRQPVRRYRYMPRWWFSEILRQALEKMGWRTFPSADLARHSISASNSGSTQIPLCAIRLV